MANITKNDLYIYDLPQGVSDSLELMYFDAFTAQVETPKPEVKKTPKVSNSKDCSICSISLDESFEAKKDHYKSDYHRLNLKRSLNSLGPLTEEEFDKLVEESSIESLSGSDDSDDEPEDKLETIFEKLSTEQNDDTEESVASYLNTKSPFILFKSLLLDSSKAYAVYKSVFTEKELLLEPLQTLKSMNNLGQKHLALFMIGGGHFAGAIISHKRKNIKGNINVKESKQEQQVEVLESKTFHRYTTRRKQGGAQSASDNARGKANSAGSSIRRYNEQALIKEVRDLLSSWKGYLDNCQSIFIRANGASNRKILVGYEGCVLQNNDVRIKSFPFTTKRATKSELKKAWVELSYLNIVDVPKSTEKKTQKAPTPVSKSVTPAPEEVDPEVKHTTELVSLLKKSKAPLLINYLKKNKLPVDFIFKPSSQYAHYPTLLHYASSQGLHHMVQILLINLKADPTIKNKSGQTPFETASNYNTKKAFQVARYSLGEDHCNWTDSKVPAAKSKEEFAAEEERAREKESTDKKKLMEEELAKKSELELKKSRFSSGGAVGGNPILGQMSDMNALNEQQRMRLMREQRARAAEARFKKMLGS